MKSSPLYLLDVSGYLFRSYHAIREMTGPDGKSTNALYGFIRSYLNIIRDFDPKYLMAVFDGPNNKASRQEVYADYKANRGPCPEDLGYQIEWARQFCQMMGIPSLQIEGHEADDAMASAAIWARDHGFEVFLCSSDKDLMQLVDGQIRLLYTHKDNTVIDAAAVKEKYGVPPEHIGDLLAMAGDTSDNVPGVSGIGPKTAAKLLEEFGSLEGILANTDKISSPKRRQVFEEQADQARMSRKLVALHEKLDVPKRDEDYQLREPDVAKLHQFYHERGFHAFEKELQTEEETPQEEVSYTLVNDQKALSTLVDQLLKLKTPICFDTETTGLRPLEAQLVGVGLASAEKRAWYIPLNGAIDRKTVLDELGRLFTHRSAQFFAHNAKYDLHILANVGIEVANVCCDTMIASYLLNAHQRHHSLDQLSLELFGFVKTPTQQLIGKGKKAVTMDQVAIPVVSDYCCEDVDYTYRLYNVLYPQLEERGLKQLFDDIELPLLRVLMRMERNGIYLDKDKLAKQGEKLAKQAEDLEKQIHQLAGQPFNIKSPKQIGEILFDKMGIKPPKKTATGYSTNAAVLEALSEEHPIAGLILEYRSVEKLRSGYVDALPGEINPETGRIHCTFQQSVAATGRLSCQDPNLQNIPVRSEQGRLIRSAFHAERKGWKFLSADYSQIELRILAHLSEDPGLMDAFAHGEDIHRFTASQVFGVPLDEVTSQMRHAAKAVNFGVIYGQQAFGLSKQIGVSVKEAADFIERYFQRYGHIREYLDGCIEHARKFGSARTVTGRERKIPEIDSKNPMIRAAAERLAINTPLQGTAADIIKMAMLRVDTTLRNNKSDALMVLQIHDELLLEVSQQELIEVESWVKRDMQDVYPLKVPLIVDVAIGDDWSQCK